MKRNLEYAIDNFIIYYQEKDLRIKTIANY